MWIWVALLTGAAAIMACLLVRGGTIGDRDFEL
jgi:hypothetical protein